MQNIEDHIAQLFINDVETILEASAPVKQVDTFLPSPESTRIYAFTGAIYGTLANSKQ